jgi:hypothetical protein
LIDSSAETVLTRASSRLSSGSTRQYGFHRASASLSPFAAVRVALLSESVAFAHTARHAPSLATLVRGSAVLGRNPFEELLADARRDGGALSSLLV